MINPRVTLLFADLPAKYPRILERSFPHILNRLMQIWDTPEFDPFMQDLMVDKRGGRQGFPLEVAAELMFLSELHNRLKKKGYRLPAVEDPWKAIPVADPTPKGFYYAIERGQQSVMVAFLNAGVTIDYRFEGGQTPLIIAATNGQTEITHYLIENGAGVNLRDTGGPDRGGRGHDRHGFLRPCADSRKTDRRRREYQRSAEQRGYAPDIGRKAGQHGCRQVVA